jgi:hypothetical protein
MLLFDGLIVIDAHLPRARGEKGSPQHTREKLLRHAATGFCSSVASDTVSNSIRVIKTTKQTHSDPITYTQALKHVFEKDGLAGVFGRGLKTRIITNGLQGTLFAILWRHFDEQMVTARAKRNAVFAAAVKSGAVTSADAKVPVPATVSATATKPALPATSAAAAATTITQTASTASSVPVVPVLEPLPVVPVSLTDPAHVLSVVPPPKPTVARLPPIDKPTAVADGATTKQQ